METDTDLREFTIKQDLCFWQMTEAELANRIATDHMSITEPSEM